MKMNINYLLLGALIISIFFNFFDNQKKEINNAAKTLSKFGTELSTISKENPITKEQKITIKKLAQIPVPISKSIKKNVVLTHGTNSSNFTPVVFKSSTGEEIKSCGNIDPNQKNIVGCNIQILDPSDELKIALNAVKPIPGKILKEGKEIPATFIIEVKALHEGSFCSYLASLGFMFKDCVDIPSFE